MERQKVRVTGELFGIPLVVDAQVGDLLKITCIDSTTGAGAEVVLGVFTSAELVSVEDAARAAARQDG